MKPDTDNTSNNSPSDVYDSDYIADATRVIFRRNVITLRERKHLSQETLALCANLHPTSYRSFESGKTPNISFKAMCKISYALGESIEDMISQLF